MNQFEINLLINILILLVTTIAAIIFLKNSHIRSKGYKFFFLAYIIFWIPIMLTRPYRGPVQNLIDPSLLVWPIAAYGFIGIFMRPLADFLALKLINRKIILQFAAIVIIISFLPIIFIQNTTTNIVQALGVGIGASAIGTYELMFKEQYGKSKAFLTVSILAIPPLIADFFTAPIQSIIRAKIELANLNDQKLFNYSLLWIIALVMLFIFLALTFFIKETKNFVGLQYNNQIISKKNNNLLVFFSIILIGVLVLFIKFSNSGTVGTLQLQNLQEYTNISVASYEGYLSTIFSVSQLGGTFLIGYLFLKKISKKIIFCIGIFVWIIYHLIASFIVNPIGFMTIHSLNGFAYGIIYNLLLGFILSFSFTSKKMYTPMGVYQSFLAMGITASSFFTTFIKNFFIYLDSTASVNQFLKPTFIINFSIIGILIFLMLFFFFTESKINRTGQNINL